MFFYKFKTLPLIFIFNEKCGCTTIKNVINDIDDLFDTNEYFDVHKHKFTNISHAKLHENTTHHVVFFVRNPYERFLSGYTKIKNKLILKIRFDAEKTLKQCNELVKDANINVEEWAEIISTIPFENIERHFKPQTFTIREYLRRHKEVFIYDIEKLSNLKEFLHEKFDIIIDCDIHDKYSMKKKEPSEKTKELVYAYYKDDFELLNYPKEFPK